MKKLNLILICLLSLSILSCSSDTENLTDEDPNEANNGNVNSEKLVKKVTWDNIETTEFTYYTDKSLKQIINEDYEYEELFFYDANGLMREEYISNFINSSAVYQYENGHLAKTFYYDGDVFCCETVYTIINNRVDSFIHYNNGIESFKESFEYDQNGNMTSITIDHNEDLGDWTEDQIITLTYDNKKNYLGSFPKASAFHYSRDQTFGSSVNTNNLISAVRQANGILLEQINYSYTYDNENFPVSMTRINVLYNQENTMTIEYY